MSDNPEPEEETEEEPSERPVYDSNSVPHWSVGPQL